MQAECKTELPRLRQRVKELEDKVLSLEKQLEVAGDSTTSTTTKKVVSEYAKWMEGADTAMEEEMGDEDEAEALVPEEVEKMVRQAALLLWPSTGSSSEPSQQSQIPSPTLEA
mmetsp:Transcript_10698/g.12938  ORF Transcript_10698/g.12938 Transcript_10698/m.12938 type:complete len:113 (-) Transcript_10698:240-578(-)